MRTSIFTSAALLALPSLAAAQTLTSTDRIEGVSRIWMEAHYNFAFFDQVPDLDWDAAYRDTLDRVLGLEDDFEYYRELNRFMALLQDGHSNVYPPRRMYARAGMPPLQLTVVGGDPVVTRVATGLVEQIPVGSVVVTVDGEPARAYAEREVQPYISASSPQHMEQAALAERLLIGEAGGSFTLGVRTPAGETRDVEVQLVRYGARQDMTPPQEPRPKYAFKLLGGNVAYLRIDTFSDEKGMQAALAPHLPELLDADGIVLDLRRNGGGNTGVGAQIAAMLSDEPMQGSAWRTREHQAARIAWGRFADEGSERRVYADERGGWYEADPRVWQPDDEHGTDAPVVVLTDWSTASAAEDFLVITDGLDHVTRVGRATFGSTGQPLFFDLPGGGSARICTKRDTFPDGRDFVGPGVLPHVEVERTVEEATGARDVTLERGLEVLREKMGG